MTTTLFSGSLAACLIVSSQAYAAYNASTTTFEGTNNSGINPTASTYRGVETLIFNMGTAGTGNYFDQASWTYAGNIQIGATGATETGLCLNNGHADKTDVFTGKVTGTGVLSKTGAGARLTVAFEGDATEYSGDIRLGSTAAFTLRFGAGSAAPAGQSAVHGVSGTGDITFAESDKDTLVYHYGSATPVYITNRISTNVGATSKVVLQGGSSYVLTKDATVSTLTLADNTILHLGTTGHSSATVLGALTMGAGAAVHVDNGSLEVVNASSLAGTYAVGSAGVLHLSRTVALDGALTVAQGGALSLGALSGFGEAGGGLQTPAEGENGFAAVNGKLSILTGSADKLQALAGTKVLLEGKNLELAGDGSVTISEVDHSAYYLRSGEKSLSSLLSESENNLVRVEMGTGAKLVVDSGAVQGSYSVAADRSIALSELGNSTIAADTRIEHLSATQPISVAHGASLTIGSTAADFAGDITLNANSRLVFSADTPTDMTVGTIRTEGGGDDYNRAVLVGENVRLHAASLVNSWGMDALTVNGEMSIDGVLQYSTGSNPAGSNRITGSGAITAGSLNISNWSYYNTLDVRSLRVLGGSDITVRTTINGGTVELQGYVSTWSSGHLTVNGGHLLLGDEVSDAIYLGADVNLTAGEITLNGTGTLGNNLHQTGGALTINGDLTLRETLTVTGTVNLNGTLQSTSDALTSADFVYSDGVNGFREATSTVLSKGEGELSFNLGENARFLLNGEDCTSSLTTDASGNIVSRNVDYTTYYLNSGSKNLSDMLNASPGSVNRISMADGTAVKADTGNLQGSFSVASAQSLSVENGGLASVMAGNVHIEQLSATGNLVADYNATLTIGSTAAANAGDISVSSGAHLNFESDTPAEMHVGTVRFERGGDNYERTMHVGEGVTLHADAVVNSWGMKSLTVDGTLNIDGTLELATGGNAEGTNRVTGSGTITAGGLNISNWGTYNIDVHELQITGNAGIYRSLTISGGTTGIQGNTTVSSELNITDATLKGHGITTAAGSNAAIRLNDGTLDNSGYALTFNSGTTLEAEGINTVSAGSVNLLSGSTLSFVLGAQNLSSAALSLSGTLQTGEISLSISGFDAMTSGNRYALLTASDYDTSAWTADNITLRGGRQSFDALTWENGTLYLNYVAYPYPNGYITYTSRQTEPSALKGYEGVGFNGISSNDVDGGAIYNHDATFTLSDNISVSFSENSASSTSSTARGGAIYNAAIHTLGGNEEVIFSRNSLSAFDYAYGGAICNDSDAVFTLNGNGNVSFTENSATADERWIMGGAIHNKGTFSMEGNGNVSFSGNSAYSSDDANIEGGAICNWDTYSIDDNGDVIFSRNSAVADVSGNYADASGGAIITFGRDATFSISNNGDVTFSENSARASTADALGSSYAHGGAIANSNSNEFNYQSSTFTLNNNGAVTFSGNSASAHIADGGAIYNMEEGTVTINGNREVTFSENAASSATGDARGGAIYSLAWFSHVTLSGNGDITFSGNSASSAADGDARGGAIYNYNNIAAVESSFTLSDNGNITFSGNSVSSAKGTALGGAIYTSGPFSLSGNGDVLFEKNAEISDGTYRLRSIYATTTNSAYPAILNLSASEGKSILFRDSVYAEGIVNLNQDGSGDIIFSGATTEADLREVKGGIDGTAQEILNSRTSEIATNASLYGGRLIVEDGALLKGQGITFTEGADATIRLNGGTLDETGYAIAVSSGSGLEFEGENTLAASAVVLADNSFLSFILDEAQTAVNWNADLDIQGGLSLRLTHEDKPVYDTYALLAMQDGNSVTGWDAANLSISGTTADHLVWENNTLYYRPMLVQENGATTLDKDVYTDAEGGAIGGKVDVSIDGNGHTLSVKDEVQLVQLALNDGIVKLEGANNNIGSATLTEGGELVLAAGAGLTTGDIISMVASGKDELVISGNITLDDKGMKGKAGEQATLSHANAQVLGDATISNVRVEDSTIDLAKDTTVGFEHVVLAATTRITDDPATLQLDDVTAELVMGVNASLTGSDLLMAGMSLTESGNTGAALTLSSASSVVMLEATTFDTVTLTGESLVLNCAGFDVEIIGATELIGLSFTSGSDYATFDSGLSVTLTLDGVHYANAYRVQDGSSTILYFDSRAAGAVPEPATATLSLLALAALAARRRRK